MGYQIGQVVPFEVVENRIQAGALDVPEWYIFRTEAQKEAGVVAWLNHKGVEAWYPTEKAWRRIPRGKRKRVPYDRTIAPRYVFARFTGEPDWAVVRSCRYIQKVVGLHGRPMPVRDEVIAEMERVPGRLAILRQKLRDARKVKPGCKAKIMDGALAGWVVDVEDIDAGIAHFVIPLLGGRRTAFPVSGLERVTG